MSRRHVRPIPIEQLDELTTERLLAYRDKLLALEDRTEDSGLSGVEVQALAPELIHFKDDPRWQELYGAVKKVLAGREHVE